MIKLSSLSKSEYKHRVKFIQEWHYNKEEQRILDETVFKYKKSYKKLYQGMRNGEKYMFMALIASMRYGKAVRACGMSAKEATDAFMKLGEHLKIVVEDEI